jgi:hypothetical protein
LTNPVFTGVLLYRITEQFELIVLLQFHVQ